MKIEDLRLRLRRMEIREQRWLGKQDCYLGLPFREGQTPDYTLGYADQYAKEQLMEAQCREK